jgi:SNF2 family DNA or RNA helicase
MANPHSIYLLTGTPISNKLEDLYAMLKLLDPGIFNWTGFANRYTVEDEGQRWLHTGGVSRPHKFRKIVGYRNELELKAKLSLHMIRRTKDEILPELPEKVFQTIEIDLDSEERRAYNALRKEYKALVRGNEITVDDTLTWMTRAQQICNSMETLPGSIAKKSSKLDELTKLVDAEAKNRKIVIFSKYKTMTSIICREFKHLHPLHLNGDTPSGDRAEMIRKFQEEDKYRIFVSTIKAGGVGITLTAADMVILYDRWWNPGGNFQAIDRLHRIGQKNSVLVVTMRVKDSVEENIEKIWMKKQITVDQIVGDEARLTAMTREELEDLL